MTHICVSKQTSIDLDNGLLPGRRQAIIWTNAGILLIGPLGTNVSEILIEIHILSFKKMHLEWSSGKWRPFCLGLKVLTPNSSPVYINDCFAIIMSADVLSPKYARPSVDQELGPILLLRHDAVTRPLANGSAAFFESCARCHWLKGLRQRKIAVVRQGPENQMRISSSKYCWPLYLFNYPFVYYKMSFKWLMRNLKWPELGQVPTDDISIFSGYLL